MTRAIAIYSCQGEAAEELSFQVGAVITKVKPDEEEGWFSGELDGKRGLFPGNYCRFEQENSGQNPGVSSSITATHVISGVQERFAIPPPSSKIPSSSQSRPLSLPTSSSASAKHGTSVQETRRKLAEKSSSIIKDIQQKSLERSASEKMLNGSTSKLSSSLPNSHEDFGFNSSSGSVASSSSKPTVPLRPISTATTAPTAPVSNEAVIHSPSSDGKTPTGSSKKKAPPPPPRKKNSATESIESIVLDQDMATMISKFSEGGMVDEPINQSNKPPPPTRPSKPAPPARPSTAILSTFEPVVNSSTSIPARPIPLAKPGPPPRPPAPLQNTIPVVPNHRPNSLQNTIPVPDRPNSLQNTIPVAPNHRPNSLESLVATKAQPPPPRSLSNNHDLKSSGSTLSKPAPPPRPVVASFFDSKAQFEPIQKCKPRYEALFRQYDQSLLGCLPPSIIKSIWSRSQLDAQTLGKIWSCLETTKTAGLHQGVVDGLILAEFCLGMYFIDCLLSGCKDLNGLDYTFVNHIRNQYHH